MHKLSRSCKDCYFLALKQEGACSVCLYAISQNPVWGFKSNLHGYSIGKCCRVDKFLLPWPIFKVTNGQKLAILKSWIICIQNISWAAGGMSIIGWLLVFMVIATISDHENIGRIRVNRRYMWPQGVSSHFEALVIILIRICKFSAFSGL